MNVAGRIDYQTPPEAIEHWRAVRRAVTDRVFAPRSRLSLSEWSDKYRFLSPDLGAPGQWRTSRVPYMREIMNAVTDPRVRRVTFMKPTRVGATQALVINGIFYCIHQEPSPVIVGLPTKDDAWKFSSMLLQPAIEDTPVIQERLQAQRERRRRSTTLQMSFPGSPVQIIGTKSPRALRIVHGRWIYKSEIDAWEGSSGDDGDPYNLIDKRAGAYDDPKYIEESSPLVKETSRIEPAFEAGSRERYFVPCPHCGEYQRLVWGGPDVHYGIKWGKRPDGDVDLENVYYVCQPNGCEILETVKRGMVQAGDWQAEKPERREHRSFHLNALVSLFEGARWPVLVSEFVETKRKPEKTRVFVNTVLAETFDEQGETADADTIASRRAEGWWSEEAPVPAGAAVLVRVTDTQGNRLETFVWAFGAEEESWLIDFQVIPGSPELQSTWDAHDEQLEKTYRHVSGAVLRPRRTFIDSGGNHTKQVNRYCRHRRNQHVFSIFGSKDDRAPLVSPPKVNKGARVVQYMIGVNEAKEALINRLNKILTPGPAYIHLPSWLKDEQVAQLGAEKLFHLGDKRIFKKTRDRNEMTDAWGYALACLHSIGPKTVARLGKIAAKLLEGVTHTTAAPAPKPEVAPTVVQEAVAARRARPKTRKFGRTRGLPGF